jgi:hypothetical protein
MVRRFALTVVAVLLAGVGSLGLSPQPTENAFTVMGIVEMSTSSDGRETVVSIDRDDAVQPADGLVDHAFRLQHATGPRFAYRGAGAITFQAHRLTVAVTPDRGWVFTVASREQAFLPQTTTYVPAPIQGLSHHWGLTIQRSADEVAAALFAGACNGTDASDCSECQAGGPGVQGCTLGGPEGPSCSADCTEGYFACCNVGSCRCCLRINGWPGARNAPRAR